MQVERFENVLVEETFFFFLKEIFWIADTWKADKMGEVWEPCDSQPFLCHLPSHGSWLTLRNFQEGS